MVITRVSFFYFVVNKRKKFCGARIDQKIEYGFRFKKDYLMYVNQFFRALLAFKCSVFFSDQKCVCNFP